MTIFQNLCLFLRLQYLPLIEAIFWERQLVGLMFEGYSRINPFRWQGPNFLAVSITNWLMYRVWEPFGQTTFSCRIKKEIVVVLEGGIFIRPDFYNTIKVKHCLWKKRLLLFSFLLLLTGVFHLHVVSKSLRGLRGTINEKAKRDLISSPFIHSKRSKVTLKWSPLLPFRK